MEKIKIDFTETEKENLADSTAYYFNEKGELVEAYGVEEISEIKD